MSDTVAMTGLERSVDEACDTIDDLREENASLKAELAQARDEIQRRDRGTVFLRERQEEIAQAHQDERDQIEIALIGEHCRLCEIGDDPSYNRMGFWQHDGAGMCDADTVRKYFERARVASEPEEPR